MKNYKIRSIRTKFAILAILIAVVIFTVSRFMLISSLENLQTDLMNDRLHADISHIRDSIGEGYWENKDGYLCLGNSVIGNGTPSTANLTPFTEFEEKTGTFSYTFIKCSDEGLVWTGDDKTGYMQGHFLRVAGSTLGPNGESIVGTYMDKQVADVLDEKGVYTGPANVSGRQIFCRYETLLDEGGNAVGAIVVGHSMDELERQILLASIKYIISALLCCLVVVLILFFVINPWINTTKKIEKYLRTISSGKLPTEKLECDTEDEMLNVTNSINEMVESIKEKEELKRRATTDSLTGLFNRSALEADLNHYINRAETKGALFMLDLDKFKDVNDSLGHPTGDELLCDISKELKSIFREHDIVVRLGGDEFVCFAKGFINEDLLKERAQTILERCRREFNAPDGHIINVTTSLGVAIFPQDAEDYDDLYKKADEALYKAKDNGRNGFVFYGQLV